MTKCAQRVFECSIEREIEILVFLHKVAIASASQIKLGCEGGDAMTGLAEAIAHGIAKLPRLRIQRLQRRVLRGDTLESVCWLPDFSVTDRLRFIRVFRLGMHSRVQP